MPVDAKSRRLQVKIEGLFALREANKAWLVKLGRCRELAASNIVLRRRLDGLRENTVERRTYQQPAADHQQQSCRRRELKPASHKNAPLYRDSLVQGMRTCRRVWIGQPRE